MPERELLTLLEILFRQHAEDFASVKGETGVFVCPICLDRFTSRDVTPEKLSDGHVWPRYIRDKSGSEAAMEHRVLLCRKCNSSAGSGGDAQLVKREKTKDADARGVIFGEREIEILTSPMEEPVILRPTHIHNFGRDEDTGRVNVRLGFKMDKKSGSFARNDPRQVERFLALADGGPFTAIIGYLKGHRHEWAGAGWVTSAYLYAFYTFGYRYVLNDALDNVRQYVRHSTESSSFAEDLPEGVAIYESRDDQKAHPEIRVVVPLNDASVPRVQVQFLDYEIHLPFPGIPDLLHDMIRREMSKRPETPWPEADGEIEIHMPVLCNKQDGHECRWDYILGKPFPR